MVQVLRKPWIFCLGIFVCNSFLRKPKDKKNKKEHKKINMLILVLFFSLGFSSLCHPQCRWACDDPVCNATCTPVCVEPDCIFYPTCNYSPSCSIHCPQDMCESDNCPACETICQPSSHLECGPIVCAPPNCSWACKKPTNCPSPVCELQCERPACEFAGGAATVGATSVGIIAVLILFF